MKLLMTPMTIKERIATLGHMNFHRRDAPSDISKVRSSSASVLGWWEFGLALLRQRSEPAAREVWLREYRRLEPSSSHTPASLAVISLAELRAMVEGHPSNMDWDEEIFVR